MVGSQVKWRAEGLPAARSDFGADRDEFVRRFAAWARENAATHRCLVPAREDQVIGMGFVAITARVPTPLTFSRTSGDVQCLCAVPEDRVDSAAC